MVVALLNVVTLSEKANKKMIICGGKQMTGLVNSQQPVKITDVFINLENVSLE